MAQAAARHHARVVRVRIEADKATYEVGEPIKVRLTLRNVSSEAIAFRSSVPRLYVSLHVTDEGNRALDVDQRLINQFPSGHWGRESYLKGGEERVLKWEDSEWMNLQDWGYRISNPGRYTITGTPYVWGDKLVLDKSIRSNEATITVAKK
jgi:hypothetical protein